MIRHLLGAGAALGLLVGSWVATPAGADDSAGYSSCQDVTVPVALTDGQPSQYQVWGRLCRPTQGPARTVQVLLHGLTYSHVYWDFPLDPDRYSYVRFANRAGFATFNLDRIGVGHSSHPPSGQVTLESNAFTIHQVVAALRGGGATGPAFERVLLVGHSFGSEIAKMEASVYSDVDAIILTGNAHHDSPSTTVTLEGLGQLVQDVPRLAAEVPAGDAGYVTLQDASRPEVFINVADADPAVVAEDSATRETNTLGEIFSIGDANVPAVTAHLRIPVLIVDGAADRLVCAADATDCSSAATLAAAEQPFYPETRVDAAVVPYAGHSVNMHLNAVVAYRAITAWAQRHVGPLEGD